jgi:hypothetical protein
MSYVINLYLFLLITSISFVYSLSSNNIIRECLDKNKQILFPKTEKDKNNCVYKVKSYKNISFEKTDNPNCESKDICISSCVKSFCKTVSFGNDSIKWKKNWIIKTLMCLGVYMGISIGCLMIMIINHKYEIKNFKENFESTEIDEDEKDSKKSIISYFIEDPDDEIHERLSENLSDSDLISKIEEMIKENNF